MRLLIILMLLVGCNPDYKVGDCISHVSTSHMPIQNRDIYVIKSYDIDNNIMVIDSTRPKYMSVRPWYLGNDFEVVNCFQANWSYPKLEPVEHEVSKQQPNDYIDRDYGYYFEG